MRGPKRGGGVAAVLVAVACAGCAPSGDRAVVPISPGLPTSQLTTPVASSDSGTQPSERPQPSAHTRPQSAPVTFRPAAALRTVRFLAGQVGPREASSRDYRRAARWVEWRLRAFGYDVSRDRVPVPAGNSWGVDVPAGVTWNVVATPQHFDLDAPHIVVGAHLDTVPQAPGAEDNASGVAVVLELARMAARVDTRLPVVFVAFGGEEPRGVGDAWHHFGSTAMVDAMPTQQRRALVAMVSLDRVGVGDVVPVCSGGLHPPRVRSALLRAAKRADIAGQACENQSSDHWSFDKAGLPAARVGGTSYAEYHSAADRPAVVDPAQLSRVGRLMWEWLSS